MFKEIDFIIFIEHRVRELDSTILIYKELSAKGYRGKVVSLHYNLRMSILRYKPNLVIVPQCYSKKNDLFTLYERLYGKSFERLNLHQEQITDQNSIEFMMPTDDYSKIIYHISWGTNFAKMLVKYGVDKNKILVTGSPRIDLILNNLNSKFRTKVANEFKIDPNKKLILIPMNFSLTDVDESYLKSIEESGGKNIRKKVEITKTSMSAFFDVFLKSIDSLKEYVLIFRPHPYEDPKRYDNILKDLNIYNNVFIIRKYSISEWIQISYKIINWTSTSALEAIISKKKVANLQPINLDDEFEMEYFRYIPKLVNSDELIRFINNDNMNFFDNDVNKYLENTFYKVDGFSSNRVAKAVQFILKKSKINFADYHISKLILIEYLFKVMIIDIPKLLLLKLRLLDKISKKYRGLKEDYILKKDTPHINALEIPNECFINKEVKFYGIEF